MILVLRNTNILVFTQFKDGRFFIIDDLGEALVYEYTRGHQLERVQALYFHEADKNHMVKNFRPYGMFMVDDEILIVSGRIIYIHQSREEIIDGILECEELAK